LQIWGNILNTVSLKEIFVKRLWWNKRSQFSCW